MHLDLDLENFDLASFTAHKINGPQGVGALFAKSSKLLRPVIAGGGQENHLRGGTENLLGIAAFGLASDIRRRSIDLAVREMTECRDLFERSVLRELPLAKVNGVIEERVCNTSNIQFPGVDGRMLVARLDEKGISCSQSSACTSSDPRPSHVLLAMGLTEVAAYESVRFSFRSSELARRGVARSTSCGRVLREACFNSQLGQRRRVLSNEIWRP